MAKSIRVLHVDDDPDFLDLAGEFLTRTDDRLDVETATSADDGLECLAETDVDCIVSDYDMPGRDGSEFLEAVRAEYPDLPFILFTGKGSEEVASEAISAGVTDYLRKESGADKYALLANRVVNAVERHAAEREVDWHQTVLGNMDEGVYVVDEDCVLQFVNYRAQELDGVSELDWTGQPLSYLADIDLLSESEVGWMREGVDSLLAGESDEVRIELEPSVPAATETVELRLTPLDIPGEPDLVLGTTRDITDRKRDEQELRRYETLIEETTDIITVLDDDGTIKYQSPSGERILGYDSGEVAGTVAFEYIHPDDRENVRETFRDLVDSDGGIERLEFRLRHADGSWRWLEAEISTEVAALDGYAVTSRDITDRKRRERERERYAAIADHMADGAFIIDSNRCVEHANEPAMMRADTSLSDVTGTPVMALARAMSATDADADRFERALDSVFQRAGTDDDTETVELDLALPTGEMTGEYNMAPVRIDGEWKVVATVRDITDRKRREETLGTLHEVTQDFMDATDKQSVAEHAVRTASQVLDQRITGLWLYDGEADALQPVAISDRGTDLFEEPPTFERGEGLAWRAFERGEVGVYNDLSEEPDRYNPDTPIRREMVLPLGEYGVMAMGRTTEGKFEDIDQALARILANTVEAALARADREAELRTQHRELQRQNERLDEFASVISHDLRNPLQVLEGSLELAEQTGDSTHFERARQAIQRMDRLITDLLTLARDGEPTDVGPICLADVVEDCWQNVETDGASLAVETTRVVEGDQSRVKQLLENLIRNAVEHGGSDVTITIGDLGDHPGFFVEDDGQGIPEVDREHVFEVGYSTSENGTGFGLSIVSDIAEGHGWTVRATDGADGGARFEVTDGEQTE